MTTDNTSAGLQKPPTAPAPAPSPWRSGPFRLFFAARSASLLADGMLMVSLTAAVLGTGHGAAGVGYALAAWMTPIVLLVLFGGVLADRFTPQVMMVAASTSSAWSPWSPWRRYSPSPTLPCGRSWR